MVIDDFQQLYKSEKNIIFIRSSAKLSPVMENLMVPMFCFYFQNFGVQLCLFLTFYGHSGMSRALCISVDHLQSDWRSNRRAHGKFNLK